MSNVYFCSDLHLKHKNIDKFRWSLSESKTGSTYNDDVIIREISRIVKPRDTLYVLGDVDFSKDGVGLMWLTFIKCKKILIRGNHDTLPLEKYLEVFDEVYGLLFKYGLQFSHAPVHPDHLRGKKNIHGHLHHETVKSRNWLGVKKDDPSYLNICPENLLKIHRRNVMTKKTIPSSCALISLDEIRSIIWPKSYPQIRNTK